MRYTSSHRPIRSSVSWTTTGCGTSAKKVEYGFWEIYDDQHTVIRLATDWATEPEKVDQLLEVL